LADVFSMGDQAILFPDFSQDSEEQDPEE